MGFLDQLVDFGTTAANTYFDIDKKMQASDLGRDRGVQEFDRARKSTREEDFNQLLFDAQQAMPDFFEVAADTSYQQNRQRRSTSRRAADMGDIDLDPAFREATANLNPGGAEYRQALAQYLGGMGMAPEAIKYGTEGRNMAEIDMFARALGNGGIITPEMRRMFGLPAAQQFEDVGPDGRPIVGEEEQRISLPQLLMRMQLLQGNNPGVQALGRSLTARQQQEAQLRNRESQDEARILSELAKSPDGRQLVLSVLARRGMNPQQSEEFVRRLQAMPTTQQPGGQRGTGMDALRPFTGAPTREPATTPRQAGGARNQFSDYSDLAGFEINESNRAAYAPALRQAFQEIRSKGLDGAEAQRTVRAALLKRRDEIVLGEDAPTDAVGDVVRKGTAPASGPARGSTPRVLPDGEFEPYRYVPTGPAAPFVGEESLPISRFLQSQTGRGRPQQVLYVDEFGQPVYGPGE